MKSRFLEKRGRILEDPVVQCVLECLPEPSRIAVYLVGGALRDRLLDRPVLDYDFVVAGDACALAGEISRKLQARYVLLNQKEGIARLILFSKEKNRVPVTLDFAPLQGRSIREDLSKRDFTCNAVALRLTDSDTDSRSSWLDPMGGMKDLEMRTIRMVHPRCFRNDPIRLLRAFRLACSLDFMIHEETRDVIREEKNEVLKTASERICDELFKLFLSRRSYPFLQDMERCGILTALFPEIRGMKGMAATLQENQEEWGCALETYRHMERGLEEGFPWGFVQWKIELDEWIRGQKHGVILLKLAALFHGFGRKEAWDADRTGEERLHGQEKRSAEFAQEILQRIRASRYDQERVRIWVRYHRGPLYLLNAMEKGRLTQRAGIRFLRRLGEDAIGVLLLSAVDMQHVVKHSLHNERGKAYRLLLDSLLNLYFKRDAASLQGRFLISGNDLMDALELPAGPMIGRLLARVEEARILGQVHDRDEAMEFAAVLWKKLAIRMQP